MVWLLNLQLCSLCRGFCSYARKSFEGNPQRQAEFDTFFEPAAQEALRRGEPPLDPDDSQRFLRLYEDLIAAGAYDT